MVDVLRLSRHHIGDKDDQGENAHHDNKNDDRDSARDAVRALGAGKSETCGVPLLAYRAIWGETGVEQWISSSVEHIFMVTANFGSREFPTTSRLVLGPSLRSTDKDGMISF